MPRLCRSNSAVPISASSAFTRCVTLDCTVLSSSAARVMPPRRATVEKVRRSVNSTGLLRSLYQMAAFSSIHYSRMLVRPTLTVQTRERTHADQYRFDGTSGHPTSGPAGADGHDFGEPADPGGERSRWLRHPWRRLWGSRPARSGDREAERFRRTVRHRLHHL